MMPNVGGALVRSAEASDETPLAADLLLCCLRSFRDPAAQERMRGILGEEIDWSSLVSLAAEHRVLPLLRRVFERTCPERLPPDTQKELRAYCHELTLRNLLLTGELLRILRLLNVHGIEAIPFKGPTLAALAYGNLSLREFTDLDIFLRLEDISVAIALLHSHGYRIPARRFITADGHTPDEMTMRPTASRFRLDYECRLTCPENQVTVELHWRLLPWYFVAPFDLDRIWSHLREVNLSGARVFTLPLGELLLMLCMHATKHEWDRLSYVCDIAELIHNSKDEIVWSDVREQARALGAEYMLGLGLRLAKDLMGVPIPAETALSAMEKTAVIALAERVRVHLFAPSKHRSMTRKRLPLVGHSMDGLLHHLRAKERTWDRFRYCLGMTIGVVLESARLGRLGERVGYCLGLLRRQIVRRSKDCQK
jgi:hypothetical protein